MDGSLLEPLMSVLPNDIAEEASSSFFDHA